MRYLIFILFIFLSFNVEAQQADVVDFKTAKAVLYIDLERAEVTGSIEYTFDVLKETDSIFIDSQNINFDYVQVNEIEHLINLPNSNKFDGVIFSDFEPSEDNILVLKYHVKPKKALYFVENKDDNQAWTQGQGKYTSNWLPSIDDMNDKIEFDLSFIVDSDYQVISNGKLLKVDEAKGYNTWHYDMQKPMSSYLVALAIGKYDKKEIKSKSGVPIELYYYPEDSTKVEPTYHYTKQMFDFLEDEIGVPYPWQNYKQVPVKDFLYSGMENTSCTIFSDDFMIDDISFEDKNYVNVNAHELAHQWFGDLVTETSGTHHWLQEGFATYYALLAERDIFGDDYYYWTLYEYAQELMAQDKAGQSTALLDPKSSSTTFYKKGAWVLHVLRDKIGDKAFKKAVKNYLNKHAFKNVETSDFISEAEKASGEDLTEFVDTWLESEKLPEDFSDFNAVLNSNELSKTSMFTYLESFEYPVYQVETLKASLKNKNAFKKANLVFDLFLDELMQKENPISEKIIIEYLRNLNQFTVDEQLILLRKAFKSPNIKIRQAIAINLSEIPSGLKQDYETLLNDNSYITKEVALYNLWVNFPQQRSAYLDKTKAVYGFNNYNIRTLWLTLAIATPEYNQDKTQVFYNELVSYTDSKKGFQLRQNAFEALTSLGLFNDVALKNLVQASKHHNWRFKSFAKKLLQSLSENEKYKTIISNLQTKQ